MAANRIASQSESPLRTFLIVWAGQLTSSLGNGMTAFALAVCVYRQTGAAAAVALVMLCLFLPAILLRPLGGLLADRFDRRVLIVLGDLGSAGGVLFILVSVLAGALVPWKIYLGVAVSSVFVALQNPAYKASVTDLLPAEHYSRASGLVQLASSAQHLVSPMAAGILLGTGGLIPILLIDLSTFAVAVAAALAIGRPLVPLRADAYGEARSSVLAELKQGWDAVYS
ncbi:MAG: MFS transporter, partial [Spirochaetaceae bacterium]